jgi:hypothetical protein
MEELKPAGLNGCWKLWPQPVETNKEHPHVGPLSYRKMILNFGRG